MKITGVAVDVLKIPVEHPYEVVGRAIDSNWHVLARITTDDGIQGFGYIVNQRRELMASIAQASRELGQHLIGTCVLETEAAWERLAKRGDWVGPGGFLHFAIAPLDIAMWDAAGKTLGQPLYRLLGGYTDRLKTYASDQLWASLSLEELAASAKAHVARGFHALKLRLGKEAEPSLEARRVQAVRQAVGPDVQIMVDASESWDVSRAMQTGRALQEAGICWLEDPVHHQNLKGLAQIAQALEIPVTGGEHLYHLTAFRDLFEAGAVDIPIIDLARVGGITPWRKIAALAQAHHMPVCGHVVPEVHVHLLAAVPNGLTLEYMPRSEAILRSMPVLEDGFILAPQAPGIGLELDEAAVQRYRVA